MVTPCWPRLTSSKDITRSKLRKAVGRRQLLLLMSDPSSIFIYPLDWPMPLHPFNLYWNTSTGHALTSLWSYTSTPYLYLVAPLKIISERHTSSYESTNASLLGILSSFWTTSLPPMELGLTKGIYKLLLYSWPQPKLKKFVPSLAYVTTIDDLSRTIRFLLDCYSNYWRKKLYFTGTPHNTHHLWLWKKD